MDFCCLKLWPDKSKSLKNIVHRKIAENNPYVVLQPAASQAELIVAPLAQTRFFRANCNYTGFDSSELTMCTGDIVEVERAYEKRYIYHAQNLNTGRLGSITMAHLKTEEPIVELQPWFFNNIDRKDAKIILLRDDYPIGTFIVRRKRLREVDGDDDYESEEQLYSLSVRDVDSIDRKPFIKHFKIKLNDEGYFYISEGYYGKHLDLLIKMYQDDYSGELGLLPKLDAPCPKDSRFTIPLTEISETIYEHTIY